MQLRSLWSVTLSLAVFALIPQAKADILFAGSSGTLSASADFALSGNTLTVTLTNTSGADVMDPTDVLTGLGFNTSHLLTPVSASLNGSTVFYGSIVNNVGEGWDYEGGINFHGYNAGVSAAGLGVFSAPNFFSPPVTPLDGIDYGLLSAGDNPATGNTGITGHGPLIDDSIVFTLTAAAGFDLSEIGSSVVFQYGTAVDEPNFVGGVQSAVPEPTSIFLLATVAAGLGYKVRRRLA
jgi:hypothetical protein